MLVWAQTKRSLVLRFCLLIEHQKIGLIVCSFLEVLPCPIDAGRGSKVECLANDNGGTIGDLEMDACHATAPYALRRDQTILVRVGPVGVYIR